MDCLIPYNGLFSKEFYFRIIRRGGLQRKFNSLNNMKPTINLNRIREISCDDSRVWLSWYCIAISRFPANFQDPNGSLLNTVPPEVIKAANKIVKQASAFTIICQYECAFSSMLAVKFLVVGMCTKIKPSKFSSPAFL